MTIIYHLTHKDNWESAQKAGEYNGDTLATEGYIHCSLAEQVVQTANKFYRGNRNLVLLEINEQSVLPEVRYEGSLGEELFPHIYGPLNLDAVIRVHAFEPNQHGFFLIELPK